jgi:hypothetical protein
MRSAQGGNRTASLHAYGINTGECNERIDLFNVDFDSGFSNQKTQTGAGEETPDVFVVAPWTGEEFTGF